MLNNQDMLIFNKSELDPDVTVHDPKFSTAFEVGL